MLFGIFCTEMMYEFQRFMHPTASKFAKVFGGSLVPFQYGYLCIPKSSNSSRGYDYNLFQSSNEDEGIIRGRESSELYRNKLHNMKRESPHFFFTLE